MPIFARNDISILHIHIPKTGGTTVEDTFLANGFEMTFRRGGAWGKPTDFDVENGCSPQHMHAALLQQHFGDRSFAHVFTLVRHPIRRFESEYRFRAAVGHRLAAGGIDEFARQVLWRYRRRNPMVLDNHIRPQSDFLWRGCRPFRLEDGMAKVLAGISDLIGETLEPASLTSMKSDPSIPVALSAESETALRDFYRADFETFGYD